MHILDNSQTFIPLIWLHQLYLRVLFGHVYSPNSTGMCPFVQTLHTQNNNYVQIIGYRGERDLANICRPDTEINGNNRL